MGPKFWFNGGPQIKEKINERGPDTLVKWLYANKRNKSLRTLSFDQMVVHKQRKK